MRHIPWLNLSLGIALAVFLYLDCRVIYPSRPTFSIREIEAAIPRELLPEKPLEVAPSSALDDMLLHFPVGPYRRFDSTKQAVTPTLTKVEIGDLERLLRSWPRDFSRMGPPGSRMIELKTDARILVATASGFAIHRDFETAARSIVLAIKLSDLILRERGPMRTYFDAVCAQETVLSAIEDLGRNKDTPPSTCKTILEALTPAPEADVFLATAERIEFQLYMLPKLEGSFDGHSNHDLSLGDSPEVEEVPTSFDALETARDLGVIVKTAIENTKRPFCKFDSTGDEISSEAAVGLPELPGLDRPDYQSAETIRLKAQYLEPVSENLLGRNLTYLAGDTRYDMEVSLKWRTLRNAVRVLLGSRLYRYQNNGVLPDSPDELIPYLGAWPKDLYDGLPMSYDPLNEVIYSVGPDLVDDGGQIEGKAFLMKDVGVYLNTG